MESNKKQRIDCSSLLVAVLPLMVQQQLLTGTDVSNISMVSKTLRKEASKDAIWKPICQESFPFTKRLNPPAAWDASNLS